jgi:hypothetical protein
MIPTDARGGYALSIGGDGTTVQVHRGDGRGDELLTDEEALALLRRVVAQLKENRDARDEA